MDAPKTMKVTRDHYEWWKRRMVQKDVSFMVAQHQMIEESHVTVVLNDEAGLTLALQVLEEAR